MLFFTHLAFGYLLGEVLVYSVLGLVIGSVLPDVIDRAIYYLDLVSEDHTISHSVIFVMPLSLVSTLIWPESTGVTIAWNLHILFDVINQRDSNGTDYILGFILWPLIDRKIPDEEETICVKFYFLDHYTTKKMLWTEAAIITLALLFLAQSLIAYL